MGSSTDDDVVFTTEATLTTRKGVKGAVLHSSIVDAAHNSLYLNQFRAQNFLTRTFSEPVIESIMLECSNGIQIEATQPPLSLNSLPPLSPMTIARLEEFAATGAPHILSGQASRESMELGSSISSQPLMFACDSLGKKAGIGK